MSNIILSKRLYIYDEVVLMLITSIIKKEDINECYYWVYELHNSGCDFERLFEIIFYDFFFILNPYAITFITKKIKLYLENKDIKIILQIVKNLFKMKNNDMVFVFRQYLNYINTNNICTNKIFRGRKPQWLSKYDKKYHSFLRYLKTKDYRNMLIQFPDFQDDRTSFIDLIKKYYNINDELNHIFKLEIQNITALSIICLLEFNIMILKHKQKIYLSLREDEYTDIHKNNFLETTGQNGPSETRAYNILKSRKYCISNNIGSFNLHRYTIDYTMLHDEIRYKWLYYCQGCEYWDHLIKKYEISFIDKKDNIKDLDLFDEFHDNYNLEFDEQSIVIQNKNNFNIVPLNKDIWLLDTFKKSRQYEYLDFDDRYVFDY
jgi:hypothetical protein